MDAFYLRDCLIYLDDILIFSSTLELQIEHEYTLKLKPSKCEFFKQRVTYLAHIVSDQGIQTDPKKTESVRTWPVPQNL